MNIKETIRAEIERQKEINKSLPDEKLRAGCLYAFNQVLSVLDTIPEQPANEGLEKEIARYLREECSADDEPSILDIARHFAEWGADHFRDTMQMVHDGLEEAAEKRAIEYAEKEMPKDADGEIWRVGDVMIENRMSFEDGFKAGAEWMARKGWISVDEKLPKMYEEVIVLADELGTAPIYKIGFGHIVDVKRCIDYNGWNCPGVKYWMPCPEIPNSD